MTPPTTTRRRLLALVGTTALAGTVPATTDIRTASFTRQLRVPLDTRPHRLTWMAWPDSTDIWGRQLDGVQADTARIARAIARFEPVTMLANPSSVTAAQRATGSGVTVIGDIPVDDCWIRDTGPVFRVDGRGGLDAIGTNFNGWGGRQVHDRDAGVAALVAALVDVPFAPAGFVGEGGAIETDGHDTLMATESSLVNANRNPGLSRTEVAAAMCRAYGTTKVIWFPGISGHDITDDHVDATSRMLRPGAALVQIPPRSEQGIWADDQREQARRLRTATTAGGEPITVTRLAGPHYGRIRSKSPTTVASYANYYLCNGAVIAAQFGDRSADRAARATLARAFPQRHIVQIPVDHLARGGGGIHCVTQQQPRREVASA